MMKVCLAIISTSLFFSIVINIIFIIEKNINCNNLSQTHNTNIYNNNYKGNNNMNMFFDEKTFNIIDPCEKIGDNPKFRKLINNKIKCTGIWCINNIFACEKNIKNISPRDCYDVEHIIDKKGPEFNKKCFDKNIAGNLIMTWSRWNRALGPLANKNYSYSYSEKITIYGKNIIYQAKKNIIRCSTCNSSDINILDNDIYDITSKNCFEITAPENISLIVLLCIFIINCIINRILWNKYNNISHRLLNDELI